MNLICWMKAMAAKKTWSEQVFVFNVLPKSLNLGTRFFYDNGVTTLEVSVSIF